MGNSVEIEFTEKLKFSKSILDGKIYKEYTSLCNIETSPQKYLKQKRSTKSNIIEEDLKTIINPIHLAKKKERMIKWFSMIYSNENNTSLETMSLSSQDKSTTAPKSTSDENDCKPKEYMDILKQYYIKNKEKFIQRVSKGPPDSIRWISWQIVSNLKEIKEDLISKLMPQTIPIPVYNQIKNDLDRTFVSDDPSEVSIDSEFKNNINFENRETILHQILHGLAVLDPELGYCQGMNFIIGFLLRVSDYNSSNEVMHMAIHLFSSTNGGQFNLRGFFIEGFPLLNLFQHIFDLIVANDLPKVNKVIKNVGLPASTWIGKWLQTLYTRNLPYQLCLRLWDNIMSYGLFYEISFSVSLLSLTADDLIKINDESDFINYFNTLFSSVEVEYQGNEVCMNKKRYIDVEAVFEDADKRHKSLCSNNVFNMIIKNYYKKYPNEKRYNVYFSYNLNIFDNSGISNAFEFE